MSEIKERQGRKLHQFLARKVYPYCPYYRELFDRHKLNPDRFRQLEDLRHIPFTTKDDIKPTAERSDKFRDFILQPTPEQIRGDLTITEKITLFAKEKFLRRTVKDQILDEFLPVMPTFTTGRTSLPVSFVYTKLDIKRLRTAGSRMFHILDLNRTYDRGLNAFPFAPHLAFWQVMFAGDSVGLLILHSGGGKVMGSDMILNIGRTAKPTFLLGTPGYIMHLAQLAQELEIKLTTISKVILGAERVSQAYKEKLRNQFAVIGSENVKIHNIYGFTEAKKAWIESSDSPDSRFLTYPDMEIFEVIDPETGEPVPEGEPGEVVYTHIGGSGSIVLRYRTGDRVENGLIYDRCPHTGLVLPLLDTKLSRVSEIKKVKGTLVDFNEMFSFFNGYEGIVEWQVVVESEDGTEFGRDRVVLRLAVQDEIEKQGFTEQLKREFKMRTEIGLDALEFLTREELAEKLGMDTRPKEMRILDLRQE